MRSEAGASERVMSAPTYPLTRVRGCRLPLLRNSSQPDWLRSGVQEERQLTDNVPKQITLALDVLVTSQHRHFRPCHPTGLIFGSCHLFVFTTPSFQALPPNWTDFRFLPPFCIPSFQALPPNWTDFRFLPPFCIQGGEVPLPSFWGGFRVVPSRFEFWQAGDDRLHDRFVYEPKSGDNWSIQRLAP